MPHTGIPCHIDIVVPEGTDLIEHQFNPTKKFHAVVACAARSPFITTAADYASAAIAGTYNPVRRTYEALWGPGGALRAWRQVCQENHDHAPDSRHYAVKGLPHVTFRNAEEAVEGAIAAGHIHIVNITCWMTGLNVAWAFIHKRRGFLTATENWGKKSDVQFSVPQRVDASFMSRSVKLWFWMDNDCRIWILDAFDLIDVPTPSPRETLRQLREPVDVVANTTHLLRASPSIATSWLVPQTALVRPSTTTSTCCAEVRCQKRPTPASSPACQPPGPEEKKRLLKDLQLFRGQALMQRDLLRLMGINYGGDWTDCED
ncbi:hypothetical protein DFH09DRAFT_1067152 [Mycena vulgaris]|nr:hypothetical protein DFH09DRAFT_1067152 [Mycena vulgaris]